VVCGKDSFHFGRVLEGLYCGSIPATWIRGSGSRDRKVRYGGKGGGTKRTYAECKIQPMVLLMNFDSEKA
jgi:hypothetical protein